jgi:hypothetical protein
MGRAIEFPEMNDVIGKPKDMTDNQCYGLPVCRIITFIPGPTDKDKAQQAPAHVSFWQFSDEEIEEIVKNRGAYVKIIGWSLFPMSIHGKKPIYPATSPNDQLADYVFSKEDVELLHKPIANDPVSEAMEGIEKIAAKI